MTELCLSRPDHHEREMISDSFNMHYISAASAKSVYLAYLRTGAKSMVAESKVTRTKCWS